MKKIIYICLAINFLATSCGKKADANTNTLEGKQAQLSELKNQQSKLKSEIETLEKEVTKLDTTQRKEAKSIFVTVAAVMTENFTHSIDLQGKVVAEDEQMITSKGAGTLTRVMVKNGDFVRAGQTVGYLDDAIMQKGISEIQQQLDFARSVYDKQKRLWDQGIGTEIQYLLAKNGVEALEKNIDRMKETNTMNVVRAPISGVIDEVYAKLGGAMAPGVPFAKIVNFSKLKVVADVAETFAGKVQKGNEVLLQFPDIKRDIKARVGYVGSSISSVNRTLKVEIPLAANEKNILPNMVSIVKLIDYKKDKAVVIPINMVQKGMDEDFVMIAAVGNAGKTMAQKVTIKVGQTYNDKAEVLSGLKAGDQLITVGYQDLNGGDLISIK